MKPEVVLLNEREVRSVKGQDEVNSGAKGQAGASEEEVLTGSSCELWEWSFEYSVLFPSHPILSDANAPRTFLCPLFFVIAASPQLPKDVFFDDVFVFCPRNTLAVLLNKHGINFHARVLIWNCFGPVNCQGGREGDLQPRSTMRRGFHIC